MAVDFHAMSPHRLPSWWNFTRHKFTSASNPPTAVPAKVFCSLSGAFAKFRTVRFFIPVRRSVRLSARNNLATNRRIFNKFYIWGFLENLSKKFKFHYNRIRIEVTLHEDQYTFLILEWKILRKKFIEKITPHTHTHTHTHIYIYIYIHLTFCWPCSSVHLTFCWPCISVHLSQ